MAHAPSVPMKPSMRPGMLLAILLTGAIGFALGQNWPLSDLSQHSAAVPEDWHGNVKRSNWEPLEKR